LRLHAPSNEFVLDELHVRVEDVPGWTDEDTRGMLRCAKHLRCTYSPCAPPIECDVQAAVWTIISLCTSLRSLSLRGDSPFSGLVDVAEVLPTSIEELEIMLPPFFENIFGSSSTYFLGQLDDECDATAAKALHPQRSPRLRAFTAHFSPQTVRRMKDYIHWSNHRYLYRKKIIKDSGRQTEDSETEVMKEPILPLCERICRERGIQFAVDVQLLISEGSYI